MYDINNEHRFEASSFDLDLAVRCAIVLSFVPSENIVDDEHDAARHFVWVSRPSSYRAWVCGTIKFVVRRQSSDSCFVLNIQDLSTRDGHGKVVHHGEARRCPARVRLHSKR